MRTLLRIALGIALIAGRWAGAQVQNAPSGVITVAGGTASNCLGSTPTAGSCVVIPNNYGAYGATFEEIPGGSPTSVSVTIQGCMRGQTCDSAADTNTSTSASDRGIVFTKVYDVFVVVAGTLSGGTNPSITVNPKISTANAHTGGSGSFTAGGDLSGTSSSQEVVGILSHTLPSLTTGFLEYNGTNWLFAAGGGGDTITSPNSTLSVGGSSSATTLDVNLANANSWTALQTFGTHISIGGVTAAGATGTSNVVFSISPTLVTPALGTPASGVITNLTGTCATCTANAATTITGGLSNDLVYQSGAGTTGFIAPVNSAVLSTNGSGVPSESTTLPSGLSATNLTLTTPALGTPSAGVITNLTGTCTSCTANSASNITGGAANDIPYQTGAGASSFIAPVNSAVLITSSGGVPSESTTLPSGLSATNLTLTTPALGTPSAGVITNLTGTCTSCTANSAGSATNIAGGAANDIPYQTGASATSFVTPVDSAVLVTSSGGVPSESTTLPTGLTLPSATLSGASTVVPSGATLTIQSGGTLTCAGGSTCPTGTGTVTSITTTGANGITISAGSTQTITTSGTFALSLGAITPTSDAPSAALSSSATTGPLSIGTLGFSAAYPGVTVQGSANNYIQNVIQNTSTGTSASADWIATNNNSSDTTYYEDCGINGGNFSGTGNLTGQANESYCYGVSGDFGLGTLTANNIHFVTDNSSVDAITITSQGASTAGSVAINGALSGAGLTNYFASPPAIGGTLAAAITGTAVTANTSLKINGGTAQIGTQGTDTKLLTAGTISGTSVALCTDANGGATTSGCPSGGDTITSPNSTLSVGGSSSATTLDVNLANANSWTALQTFGTHISIGGVTAAGATGTSNVVFSISPTLVTPALGTPASGTLTNTTGYEVSSLAANSASVTLAQGNFPTIFNCAQTSNTQACFTVGETTAASGGSADIGLQVSTLTTSAATPLQITQGAAGPAATNAPPVLNISAAAAGGAASASINGPTGAPITLLTGAGAAGGATTGNGGTGGAFTVTLGAGGAHGGTTTNTGGVGGAFSLTPGAGTQGAATGAGGAAGTLTVAGAAGGAGGSTSGTGGAGSDVLFTTGTGGAATAGSTTGRGGNAVFTLGSAGGTGTAGAPGQFEVVGGTVGAANTTPFVNVTGTWNTSGVVDAGILENITNTGSGAFSKLLDLQVGGSTQFNVGPGGEDYRSSYSGNTTTGSITVSPDKGAYQTITLTGNLTVAFTQPTSVSTMVRLVMTQAASGGPYTITWTSVKWPGGVAPVMSSGASQVDIYSCMLNGTTTYCTAGQNFQ